MTRVRLEMTIDGQLESMIEREEKLAAEAADAASKAIHETLARCATSARRGGGARRQLSLFAKNKRVPPPADRETLS